MENCLEKVADEMYSKGLINREVRRLPTFDKMDVEFSALMSLYTDDVSKLEELCSSFLSCIASVEGPAKKEAIALAKDWECEVFKSHQMSFSLTKKTPAFIQKEVQLSAKDQLAKELQNLQKRYAIMITKIITNYATSGKHDTLCIARWVQTSFDETGLARDGVTIDEIFERMKPHYSFLDIDPINDLIEAYPIDDTSLESKFDQYTEDLDSFIESARLDDVMTTIEAAIIGETTKVDPKIILKLSGKWSERTIGNLRKLTHYLFGEEAKHLTIKKILSGSIQIQFLVSSYKIVPALIKRAEACVQFMGHFGIFHLTINNQTIIDRDENVNFCFEKSLLFAIKNFNNNGTEYESMVYVLVQLSIDMNYQNEQGNTALMLASEDQPILIKDPDINIKDNNGVTGCCDGHHHIVELLLSKDPDINIQDNNGWTALMHACCYGHHQVVKLLLSKDPDINIQDNDGRTALMHASWDGHHGFELLLSKDPDINIQDNNGWTVLMHASCYGHHQVVELLLGKDPAINIQDNYGWTALMHASYHGHHQAVKLLLSKGPSINIQNNIGWTVLMFASGKGHHQVVELLLSNDHDPDIDIQDNNGWTALIHASRYGHHQVVELLLSKNPDINFQDNDGRTALIYASRYGHYQVVELLLSKDPDINIQNNDGRTALIHASCYGHHQVVELLLSKDPDINIQDNDGWTALMNASWYGHHQVVELLLNRDPDINIQDINGWTALMHASCYGHHQFVELLLSQNPDINIQDNFGWTALMTACRYGHCQVVEHLLSNNPDINIQNNNGWTALIHASCYGHCQVVELLLSKDPDINIQSNNGWTALMFASGNGHHQVVKLLLSKVSDINCNILGNDGWTALMLASGNGHHKVVELLLSNDPDINNSRKCDLSTQNIINAFTTACYEGRSSMMNLLSKKLTSLSNDERKLLVVAAEGDVGTLVSMLFEVGMSPDTPLVGGITPLMIAASCGHVDIVDTLIQAGADVNKTNDEGKTALDVFLDKKEEGTSSYIIDLLITNRATAAQANPARSLSRKIFAPLSNISLIHSMTEAVERPVQINKPPQKVEELLENEFTQQHKT